MRTVSRKWDWINAARETIKKYQEVRKADNCKEALMLMLFSKICNYCACTTNLDTPYFTCHGCIQNYITNTNPKKASNCFSCTRFSTYIDLDISYNGGTKLKYALENRIRFHEEVIRFLMDIPDYATDAYIFEKIANLELK